MSRKISFFILITIFFAIQSISAQENIPDWQDASFAYFEKVSLIPDSILNNEFYRESLRQEKLARDNYDYGDYDASIGNSEEAIRYAALSDKYVAGHMIIEAKRLLDWADSNDIANRYPNDYSASKDYYDASLTANDNEKWNEAIASAVMTIEILSALNNGWRISPLPSQYIVRTWSSFKDCLWNIAGYSWVYGDPLYWRILYEANKSRLTDPDNPDLIEPGMLLDIPSISGEARQGLWDSNRVYNP